jgi:hypothetical protein
MMDGRHISQEDLALYAMQALSAEETAEVRLHLTACALCRDELAEVSGDLALVAMSVEQHAVPEGARHRFIEKIAAAPAHAPQAMQAPVNSIAAKPKRTAIWLPWALAAGLAILAVMLGVRNRSLQQEMRVQADLAASQAAASAHAQEVLDLLTAPAAQHVLLTAAKTHAEPTARAVYLPSRGALILQASNLAPLSEDKTYELWVIPANGSAPIPAGLFRPDAAGSAGVVLPPLPKGVAAKAFGVTIEKASGADTPTAPIILSGAAPAAGE